MEEKPVVRIGIIGYGMMGKVHSYGYAVAPLLYDLPVRPVVVSISGRNIDGVAKAAEAYKIPHWSTDWRELINNPEIDLIDICTPPSTHSEIAIAAAKAGKAIICEKPLALNYEDSAAAASAVALAEVPNAVGFNYRRLPAVSLMKKMIDQGDIGEIILWRCIWLTDEFSDPSTPFDWRFDRSIGGTTIADLGCHVIDLALWMVGDIDRVNAHSTTFTKHRSSPEGPKEVTVDEASSLFFKFKSGASGTLEVGRIGVRQPCDMRVEINGTKGTLIFDYAKLNELLFGSNDEDPSTYGMKKIRAEHSSHPYAAHWWPIGQGVGYGSSFVNQVADWLGNWPNGKWEPDFAQGARVQAVVEAAEISAATEQWVSVTKID
jgi:predicted dehydrogenase